MSEKFYITTSVPYVNAKPHIGTAIEYIYADVLARYHRQHGADVKFVTGTDEHGQKNVQVAEAEGVTPQQHVDRMARAFQDLVSKLNISNDDFIRTTEERHKISAQEFWKQALKSGDIEKGEYEGLYCIGCEAYKTEKELEDGLCVDHNKAPERLKEENYFFRLSRYKDRLLEFYKAHPKFVVPQSKYNEIIEFVKDGPEDISISREQAKLSWGVPVPDDDSQVMYVWFEALTNYLTALKFGEPDDELVKWWPADYHIVGKDINRFHSVIWPAMLMAAEIDLPHHIGVHGFITVEGQKMSKTVGNVIDPIELIDKYGVEPVRFFLMQEVSFHRDGDFSYALFEERYQSHLANGLGNLLSRVTNMVEKYFAGELEALPRQEGYADEDKLKYKAAMEELKFGRALEAVWGVVNDSNEYIEENKPWELAKTDQVKLKKVLQHLLFSLGLVADWLVPFMPETASKISDILAADKMVKAEPLFPRLEG